MYRAHRNVSATDERFAGLPGTPQKDMSLMIRIALIVPSPEIGRLFAETLAEHNRESGTAAVAGEEYHLETHVMNEPREVEKFSCDADVIVARGLLAQRLQQRDYYVPVVEIPVTINDLIRCVQRLQEEVETPRIAVVAARRMTAGAEELSAMLHLPIRPFPFESREEIPGLIEAAVRMGLNAVIGGVCARMEARQRGIAAVPYESGRESIWHAITEAKRVAHISRREKERSQNLSVIVNQSFDGIVALDEAGRVTLFNAAAERLLKAPLARAMGAPLEQLIADPRLRSIIEGPGRASTEIVHHDDRFLAVNTAPIRVEGGQSGTLVTIQDATRIQHLETKIRQRIHSRGLVARHSFEDILGTSARIRHVIQTAKDFSGVDSNILIVGETGTGKELFAQSIHNHSDRHEGPFVAFNCAALSESLLESELFGYASGAFTGAARDGKSGLFELAHRGTIFLDEISEISPRLQALLLRVLQEREIRRLGDDRVIPVDVRVVASTNLELHDLVRSGRFREDLYYRLDILRLAIPSLAERREDIPLLAAHWITVYARQMRRIPPALTEDAGDFLLRHPWPGNVRQLRNVCERLVVLGQRDTITETDVRAALTNGYGPGAGVQGHSAGSSANSPVSEMLLLARKAADEEARTRILSVLQETRFSMKEAAEMLGVDRSTLWRRMRKLGLLVDRSAKRRFATGE